MIRKGWGTVIRVYSTSKPHHHMHQQFYSSLTDKFIRRNSGFNPWYTLETATFASDIGEKEETNSAIRYNENMNRRRPRLKETQMTRVTRRVLQMSDRELEAVIAVAMPGRKIEGLRRDERQEICMKWLFANGLSINHQFTLDIEDDDIYVLMSNKSACACCTKDTDVVSVKHFDSGAIGTSLAIFSKLEEDGVVELQIPTKREPPQDVSCWKAAYREFGLCCFSLSSLC
ncbi:hypothetical protein RB195_008203 [Necator americanus]|uniref:Phospholipid scramblase n=1 Tax=Necator americanus TaxID=51031 RepID=A0ABR1CNT3_NECAM